MDQHDHKGGSPVRDIVLRVITAVIAQVAVELVKRWLNG